MGCGTSAGSAEILGDEGLSRGDEAGAPQRGCRGDDRRGDDGTAAPPRLLDGLGGGPWLLACLECALKASWSSGSSWRLGASYLVLESGPDHERHLAERRGSGGHHVALWASARREVDALTAEASEHGWTSLFGEEPPHAGVPGHYAATSSARAVSKSSSSPPSEGFPHCRPLDPQARTRSRRLSR